jgi:hypothetical protein
MRFDLQKIDERIKKLQEIRKLATDPEAASLLLEFMSPVDERLVDERTEQVSVHKPDGIGATTHSSDNRQLDKEVVNAKDATSGSGLWTRARG